MRNILRNPLIHLLSFCFSLVFFLYSFARIFVSLSLVSVRIFLLVYAFLPFIFRSFVIFSCDHFTLGRLLMQHGAGNTSALQHDEKSLSYSRSLSAFSLSFLSIIFCIFFFLHLLDLPIFLIFFSSFIRSFIFKYIVLSHSFSFQSPFSVVFFFCCSGINVFSSGMFSFSFFVLAFWWCARLSTKVVPNNCPFVITKDTHYK